MKNMQSKYPNKLKEIRTARGLLQKDIAKALNMQLEDRISRWEKGQSIPSLPNLIKLCRVYKTKIEDLYPEL